MKPFDRVQAFWQHHGFPIITADSDPTQPFHICEARNNAARQANTAHLIIADADTIPDIGAVHQALTLDGITWPFTEYRHIPATYTDQADLMSAPADQTYRNSVGGLLVTPSETYWELGGMDERFHRRWGYEDNAFALAAKTLSKARRIDGIVFSFNHSADRDLSTDNPNRHRYELYKFAAGRPEIMRELIRQ